MKNKVKGIDALNTMIVKKCSNCGFETKSAETKKILCFACLTLEDKRIVMEPLETNSNVSLKVKETI